MRFIRALCAAALTASASLMLAAPASAAQTPAETGCPASNAVLVVADIAPVYGEEFLAMVDTNGNGLVCGKPLSDAARDQFCRKIGGCGTQFEIIYGFRDDDITR